jgi:hypothetical protein
VREKLSTPFPIAMALGLGPNRLGWERARMGWISIQLERSSGYKQLLFR